MWDPWAAEEERDATSPALLLSLWPVSSLLEKAGVWSVGDRRKPHWTESFSILVENFLVLWIQTVLKCELTVELCLTLVQVVSGEVRMDDANCYFLRRGM